MAELKNEIRDLLNRRVMSKTVLGRAIRSAQSGVTLDLILDVPEHERWAMVLANMEDVRAAVLRLAEEVEMIDDLVHHVRDKLDDYTANRQGTDTEH